MNIKYTRRGILGLVALGGMALSSCAAALELDSGAVAISVEAGPGGMHRHPLFLGLSMQTPPQFAVWVEDTGGNYVATLAVSRKSATQGWLSSPGEGLARSELRRPEAHPALAMAAESYEFALLGQGSADGSGGAIGALAGITDAAGIQGRMTATAAP